MIAIGIGANSSATVADVERALSDRHADVIATLAEAACCETVQHAARNRAIPAMTFSKAILMTRSADCQTHSERSLAAHGVSSVAEAAALVAAGDGSTLITPRQAIGPVTIAIARSAGAAA